MSCPNRRRARAVLPPAKSQLVTLDPAPLNSAAIKSSAESPERAAADPRVMRPERQDFYCDRCGETRFAVNLPYDHVCDPNMRGRTFVDYRRDQCTMCEASQDGKCMDLVQLGREGDIEYGIRLFHARCPRNHFLKLRLTCPECGRDTTSITGVSRCRWCGYEVGTETNVRQKKLELCHAVTALSALPKHQAVQKRCLQTWKDFGLTIHVVNSGPEIEQFQPIYGDLVDQWHLCTARASSYPENPTIRIVDLARMASKLRFPVLLINSDIELHGPQKELTRRLNQPRTLLMGIRQNFEDHWRRSTMEKWGIDAFVLTPEMARSLPGDAPFGIGKPVWDYWIPYHFQQLGYRIDAIGEGTFFHKTHPIHWTRADWRQGAEWVKKHYDAPGFTGKADKFRNTLPYPPTVSNLANLPKPPRILFHHVPKTAGTSITSWLDSIFPEKERFTAFWQPGKDAETFRHFAEAVRDRYRLIAGHDAAYLEDALTRPADTVRCAVFREPIDRMVSLYCYHLKLYGDHVMPQLIPYVEDSVETNHYAKLGGVSGILDRFNVIGFQADVSRFCRDLAKAAGLPEPPATLPVLNVTEERENVADLPKPIIDKLTDLLKDEIQIYKELQALWPI